MYTAKRANKQSEREQSKKLKAIHPTNPSFLPKPLPSKANEKECAVLLKFSLLMLG
jgi:hypothetical protein